MMQIILGNSSADIDSAISAIALASVRGALPLINIPKQELKLHLDLLDLCEQVDINTSSLLFREDIPRLLSSSVEWVLVDHNVLTPEQEELAPYVLEIIDHHKDEKIFYPQLKKKTIRRVGSCATLIAQETWEKLDQKLALGLLSAILLDTGNLQDVYRVTSEDITMSNTLRIKAGDIDYQRLLSKREQVDLNIPEHVLSKDYKSYRYGNILYGISSLSPYVAWGKENLESWYSALPSFIEHKKIDLLILLIPGPVKKAIFYSPKKILKPISHELFVLREEMGDLFFYDLKKPLPRKDLQPLLHDLFPLTLET